MTMDDLDRRIVGELRINGRASVPRLAQILGVARGTVQTRLDRLTTNGTIRGFTVQIRESEAVNQVRAIMLIELGNAKVAATVLAIKKVPGFNSLSNTNGTWDLIAEIEVPTLADLGRLVSTIRAMDGVAKSESFIRLGPA